MAIQIQGTPVITDSRALESVSIKLDANTAVITNIIDSATGISTGAPSEAALLTEKALMDNIITPIYNRLDDAFDPTDADFSTTDLVVKNLSADPATGVITAFQFKGDGSNLTDLSAANITAAGTLPQLNAAALTDLDATNIATGELDEARLPATLNKDIVGNLSGNVTGNVTGNADTATNADNADAVNGSVTTADLTLGGTNLTAVTSDIALSSAATEVASADAVKTYVDGLVGSVNLEEENAAAGEYFLPFAVGSTGTQDLKTDNSVGEALRYNPSTGTLSAKIINGLSDRRYKENIVEIVDPVGKINALRGVTFDWKSNGAADAGVIAQEVQAVMPELISENEESMTVNYNGLVGLLIAAVKELSAEVEGLKAAQ